MTLLRICKVEPLQGLRLKLTLTDGSTVKCEISHLLVGPVLEKIRSDGVEFVDHVLFFVVPAFVEGLEDVRQLGIEKAIEMRDQATLKHFRTWEKKR